MTEDGGAGFTMPASQAVRILSALSDGGVGWTVGGGWAVDALVGRQTRAHSDLDLWVPADDLDPLISVVAGLGIDRLLAYGGDRPWNFVLHDGSTHKIDLHLYEVRPDGDIHYGSAITGHRFPAAALAGRGEIDGQAVRCDAPEWSLSWHTGYPARDQDRHDIDLLCLAFGLDPPTIGDTGTLPAPPHDR